MHSLAIFVLFIVGCTPLPMRLDLHDHVTEAVVALVNADGELYCAGSFVGDYIVTAAHCVDEDTMEEVGGCRVATHEYLVNERLGTFSNHYRCEVVRSDEFSDVAILRIVGADPPHGRLYIGQPEAGERAYAVGHPGGLAYTWSSGIVSYPRRSLENDDGSHTDWVQTDAPVFFGNSGGPLVNEAGELIGVCRGGLILVDISFFAHPDNVLDLLRQRGR